MSEQAWNNLKWVKISALLAACVSVIWVDHQADSVRYDRAIEENRSDLECLWGHGKQIAEAKGVNAFPLRSDDGTALKQMSKWKTLEAFLIGAYDDTSPILTKPAIGNIVNLFERSKQPGYDGRLIECWNEAVKAAREGAEGSMITLDLGRQVNCIMAYGLVRLPDGREAVLVYKMDVWEAASVSPPNRWDEILVCLFCLLVSIIIYVVHIHRGYVQKKVDKLQADYDELQVSAVDAIETNQRLQSQIEELKNG